MNQRSGDSPLALIFAFFFVGYIFQEPNPFKLQRIPKLGKNPKSNTLMEPQENSQDNLSPSLSSPSPSNSPKKKKRTRDLPNLSQCHSCGFRIDSCSGNDTLHTLYSEWRIVLLCQNCFVGVESSTLCSYCFKTGSSDDSFCCPQCNHIIHKTCFHTHADVPPWSFCCSSATSHFSICLDCWVPKLVADKRAYCNNKRKNTVVFDVGNCRKRLLEDVVRDANFDAQRKAEAATRARQLAVEKALGARRAAQLANKAVSIMTGDRDDNAVSEVDDVELAMQAMNCSLKILKDFCLVNSTSNSNPLVTDGSCRTLEVSPGVSVPATSVRVGISDFDSSNGNDDVFLGKNAKDCDMTVPMKDEDGGRSNKLVSSVSQSGLAHNLIKYTRRTYANLRSNGEPDRYKMKYTRRALVQETNNANTNQYLLKYARRTSTNQRYKGKLD